MGDGLRVRLSILYNLRQSLHFPSQSRVRSSRSAKRETIELTVAMSPPKQLAISLSLNLAVYVRR